MSVRVNGKLMKGSPYNVVASCDYTSLSKPSKIVNNDFCMGKPWGIGFSRTGKWAVADWSNYYVYLYDDKDQLVRTIGTSKWRASQFICPSGVAYDDNHLYTIDDHRVQKFTSDGDYLLQFGRYGSNDGEMKYPFCLTVHNGKVYVADSDNNRISVYNTDGTFH